MTNRSYATITEAFRAGYVLPDEYDVPIVTEDGPTYRSPDGQVAEILWFSKGTNRRDDSGSWEPMFAPACLNVCPACGRDLKREGFPHQHQHADSGEPCSYVWG